MLSNGHDEALVVRARVDRTGAVSALREPFSHFSAELTIDSDVVQAFEKGELPRVGRRCLLERVERLDDEVAVAEDLVVLHLLRRSVVVALCVDEVSGNQPVG